MVLCEHGARPTPVVRLYANGRDGMYSTEVTPRERPVSPRALLVSLAALSLAGVASSSASALIATGFTDRPAPRDLLFEVLPHMSAARYPATAALVLAFALLLRHGLQRARHEIPRFIAVFALMYLLRAAIMVMTPLANAHGPGSFVFPFVQNGMFPSGHTAAAVLCVRLVDPHAAPRLRLVQTVLAWVLATGLLVSHGHYSIDIVGGFLLAFFVEQEWATGRLFTPLKRLMGDEAA